MATDISFDVNLLPRREILALSGSQGFTASAAVAVYERRLQVLLPEQQLDSHITFLQAYAEAYKQRQFFNLAALSRFRLPSFNGGAYFPCLYHGGL